MTGRVFPAGFSGTKSSVGYSGNSSIDYVSGLAAFSEKCGNLPYSGKLPIALQKNIW